MKPYKTEQKNKANRVDQRLKEVKGIEGKYEPDFDVIKNNNEVIGEYYKEKSKKQRYDKRKELGL